MLKGLPASRRAFEPRDSFLVFGAPFIGDADIAEVVDTLRSGWLGFGPKCLRFEDAFARYFNRGSLDAVSVSSCTAAMHLALLASGVGPGDEVITTTLTFAATVNVIEMVGATPVLVDVDPDSQNMTVDAVEAAISPRTHAIIPVHMAGRPCDMHSINKLAARENLVVIEDAAHAIEARIGEDQVGAHSPFIAFSFYATKNMTTAEGGMLLVSDPAVSERVRRLRLHGLSSDAWGRYGQTGFKHYEVSEPGYKYNMTDIQASLGLHQLARLDANLRHREMLWRAYDEAFRSVEGVVTPTPASELQRHARHLYTVRVDESRSGMPRDDVVSGLHNRQVGAGVHFRPVHLHPYYRERYGYREGMFPNAEAIGRTTVSLPLSAVVTLDDVEYVVDAVQDTFAHPKVNTIVLPEAVHPTRPARTVSEVSV